MFLVNFKKIIIPLILDSSNETKSQVIERMSSILNKNVSLDNDIFLILENVESVELKIQPGFVVNTTLIIDSYYL
jgi:hypothetical protein